MASKLFLSFLLLSAILVSTAFALDPEVISVMSYKANIRVHPFPKMTQTTYHVIEGATVNIETNFVKGRDELFVDYQGKFPIRGTFDDDVGVLYLEGKAPITEYAAALSSIVFITTAEDGLERKITSTFGKNTFYVSSTRHFYEIIDRQHPPWSEGNTSCANKQYMETFQGYLATVGSEDELVGIGSKVKQAYWVGAKRSASGDLWSWACGPDNGAPFWKGKSIYTGGAPYPNEYSFASWRRFQPNDGGDSLMINISNAVGAAHFDDGSDVSDVQGYICEYGGLEGAATANQYQWYTDTTILRFDCSLFASTTECNNRKELGCSWSGSRCSNSACSGIVTQRECVANWQCGWNTDGHQGLCVSTACSKFSGSACAAPLCQEVSVAGSSQCRDAKCYNLVNSDACSKKVGCNWRGTFTSGGAGRCYLDRSIDCSGSDVVYMLDGTAKMSEEYNKFTSGFFALSQMIKESDLALTGLSASEEVDDRFGARIGFVQWGGTRGISTDTANMYTKGKLSGLMSEVINDLSWHQAAYTASVTPRTAEAGLEKAYNMIMASGSARPKIIVMVATGGLDDAERLYNGRTTASSILKKITDAKITIIGISLRPSFPDTPDSVAAVRDLKRIGALVLDITLGEFADRVIYGLCSIKDGTAGALISVTPKGIDCEDHLTYDTCNPNALCQWDHSSGKCGSAQCLGLAQAVCNANPACTFETAKGRCSRICASYSTQATCTSGCVWRNSGSVPAYCDTDACLGNINEDSCVAENGCYYNTAGVVGKCEKKICLATDAASCEADSKCVYKMGYCFINTCAAWTSQVSCNIKEQCAWDATKTVKCQPNECAYYQGEAACAGDSACLWSTASSPAMCVRAPCSYLAKNATDNYENECKKYDQCYWQSAAENGLANICIPRICESNKKSCDCMKMDGCVWRDNQCKNSVFTQCTAADAVFLVESTRTMDQSFSRHPSGIQGAISSIRTWAKAAPIAPNSGAAGFRLGLIGYGSTGAALYPTKSPCSNSNTAGLCSSVSSFVGPTSAVTSYLESVPSYVNGVPAGVVAIKKGLEAALDLFRANAVTQVPRKKMLVVIGNSVITDGNALLNQTISELEGLGVTIFSILMQRFDTVSAPEAKAAEFMGPIASDPIAKHFSYTTVENFYTSVLDNFCDPTTNTGEALGVSRNGILPCDWLNGATECNIESSCSFDTEGSRTCSLPSQCPNLGCVALPAALVAQGFACKNCKLVSGAFQCSFGLNEQPPRGLCRKDSCTVNNCDSKGCTEALPSNSCFWSTTSTICLRSMCRQSTRDTCNTDLGCVWTDASYSTASKGQAVFPAREVGCTFSGCGKLRDGNTCTENKITNTQNLQCQYNENLSPAICIERRCIYLDQNSCNALPVQCEWVPAELSCKERQCQYTSNEGCEMDTNCYWDPFQVPAGTSQRGTCLPATGDCRLSPVYGSQPNEGWSEWSSRCGANAIRTRSRTILAFPVGNGQTCDKAAEADGSPLFQIQTAAAAAEAGVPGYPEADCSEYCSTNANPDDCADHYECQWSGGSCKPVDMKSCLVLSEAECSSSDMCKWDSANKYCKSGIQVCQPITSRECTNQLNCVWRTGANDMTWGKSTDASVHLVNPNEQEIFPFVTLHGTDDRVVDGASVTIEENYQRGKDVLDVAYPIFSTIKYKWNPVTATLSFSGQAPITEYLSAIRFVTFVTSSQRVSTRTITYALGANKFYCAATGHLYEYAKTSATWDQAKANCGKTNFFGYHAYLATVSSEQENSLLSAKMNAEGWLSGDDYVTGVWRFSSGPDFGRIFWTGDSPINGGYAGPGQYANWDTVANQPVRSPTGYSHPYMNKTGYWNTQPETFDQAVGYICEFFGLPNDVPNNLTKLGDSAIIGIGGCMPTESCGIHTTADACAADYECLWRGNKCTSGCNVLSTSSECASAAGAACNWDTNVVPPVCDINPCTGINQTRCAAAVQCTWANNGCARKTGCAQFVDKDACDKYESCIWTSTSGAGHCDSRSCRSITSEFGCLKNPTCEWSAVLGCTTSLCKYGTRDVCGGDSRCTWNQPDSSVAGFMAGGEKIAVFTAGSQRPTDFTSSADGMVVAIVEGFQSGSDVLSIDPVDRTGTYVSTYNPAAGVLTIRVANGATSTPYDAFGFLQSNVKFYTSSGSSTTRLVSFTIGSKTVFSPINRVYYRAANVTAKTRAEAETICVNSRWMGQAGRLASITSEADNTLLATVGSYGWIAARNAGGNSWTWGNTPTAFWTGAASLGAPSKGAFAMWAIGEPVSGRSGAFMTETGAWKAVDNVAVAIPVLCEYGAPTVDLQMYGTRAVKPVGCFATPCLDLSRLQCVITSGCSWNQESCQQDTFCSNAFNSSVCNKRELCYWDSSSGSCRTAPDTVCSRLRNKGVCIDYAQCEWREGVVLRDFSTRDGACYLKGCASHPAKVACVGDSLCRWDQPAGSSVGQCTNRLCGYTDTKQCWADSFCEWDYKSGYCQKSACFGQNPCPASNGCRQVGDVCAKAQCSAADKSTCHSDPDCLWAAGSCTKPACSGLATEAACSAQPQCYFTYKPIRCAAAQCTANLEQTTCEKVIGGMAQCRWTGLQCRELTWLERNAPAASATCEKEVDPDMWWVWALLGLIVIIVVLIMWRLYLAYAKGLNFFEPQRRNVKYSPHAQFAADLLEEAQAQAEETNIQERTAGNNRPSLNDL